MRSFSLREPGLASPLRSAQALFLHRFLFRFAFAGAHVFAWIFIFQYFYLVEPSLAQALARTALLYALSQTVTCLATPYAARLLRSGARRVFVWATVLAASSFVVLGATFEGFWGAAYAPTAVALFAIGLGLYRAFYWIPYEIEVQATGKSRGNLFTELLVALAPVLGGLCVVAASFGPLALLYTAAGLMLISVVPIFYLRDVHEGFSWGYRETFGRLVEPANRTVALDAFFEGISGAALLLFWPLAIFIITGWSYGMLGVILTLTFVIAIFARSFVRKSLRRSGLHTSNLLKVVFAVTPWAFRTLVGTPLGAVFVDSYFYTTTPRRIGLDPLTFEQAADAGSYVDEYTALKEMGLALGRIAVSIVGALAVLAISLPAAFIVVFLCAALASAATALSSR
ncbi:hypothetical protein EXS56_03310 [Candidatus Kaiserbacteria bacterium]|nr:hypothetical protein [Candidatus Kaiserbacteria bacterium]